MNGREDPRSEPLPEELERKLSELGDYLVWRIGTNEAEDVLIVRVGLASKTPRFNELPTLRNIGEQKIAELVKEGRVRVEWVE